MRFSGKIRSGSRDHQLHVCVYNSIYVYMYMSLIHVHVLGIQMMYCAQFHEPDHFSSFAHVHEEKGKGREGKDIIPIYVWGS